MTILQRRKKHIVTIRKKKWINPFHFNICSESNLCYVIKQIRLCNFGEVKAKKKKTAPLKLRLLSTIFSSDSPSINVKWRKSAIENRNPVPIPYPDLAEPFFTRVLYFVYCIYWKSTAAAALTCDQAFFWRFGGGGCPSKYGIFTSPMLDKLTKPGLP